MDDDNDDPVKRAEWTRPKMVQHRPSHSLDHLFLAVDLERLPPSSDYSTYYQWWGLNVGDAYDDNWTMDDDLILLDSFLVSYLDYASISRAVGKGRGWDDCR